MSDYFAHTANPEGQWHVLSDHLNGVAELAKQFAEQASPHRETELAHQAYWAGQLHDLGKYRKAFQQYLRQERQRSEETHHAIYGAALAYDREGHDLAFVIAGHHAGLHNCGDLQTTIEGKKYQAQERAAELVEVFEKFGPKIPHIFGLPSFIDEEDGYAIEFYIRFLFSLLVDADFLDTEAHHRPSLRHPQRLNPEFLLQRLQNEKSAKSQVGELNELRHQIYEKCLQAGQQAPGFFSLTVPTGGGKTLSGMAFALKHAAIHDLRRIIVVIPYLSIIEQNASEYRRILDPKGEGIVIEHHSATNSPDDSEETRSDRPLERHAEQYATENWDAPIIVTTAVQFIESLFACQTSRCRKLHNIARSVVIFDEVQTLPTHLLNPLLNVLRTLQKSYGVSFLFSTATQPAFSERPQSLTEGFKASEIREINDQKAAHFQQLQRVTYQFPTPEERLNWDDLAAQIIEQPQALCIVNIRQHAFEFWEAVRKRLSPEDQDGLFHLSSAMCAQHRFDLLGEMQKPMTNSIRFRLQNQMPCWLISTQLIEAGVDVDFPSVYRALGPLDSIVQAAGRCNREGKLRAANGEIELSKVIIFRPEKHNLPRGIYCTATELTTALLDQLNEVDLGVDSQLFGRYFDQLYDLANTDRDIQARREKLHFREVAELARVIRDETCAVIVPYGKAADLIEVHRNAVYDDKIAGSLKPRLTRDDVRKFQRFMVNLRKPDFIRMKAQEIITPLLPNLDLWVLDKGDYHQKLGLLLNQRPLEDSIW